MYIYLSIFLFFIFFNNLNNYFLICFLMYFLIYYTYTKGYFTIFDANMFLEDRLVIMLENVIKIDYNLITLLTIILLSKFILRHYSNNLILIVITFNFLSIYINYQDFMYLFFNTFSLNSKLINGLFLIHPYCIYVFYSFIFILVIIYFYTLLYFNNFNFKLKSIFFYFLKKLQVNILLIGTIALVLGAWWAYQEINWNNWWSWDLIEIINFILILLIFKSIHQVNFYGNFYTTYIYKCIILVLLLFFLIISRYNILNSLHSFVVLNNFNQYSFFFLCFFFMFFFINYNRLKFNMYIKTINLVEINKIAVFFYLYIVVYVFKIYYEIFLFLINKESFLEYLYFFKYINMFILLTFLTIYTIFFKFFFLCFFIYFINYLEIIIIIAFLFILFKQSKNFFFIHFSFFLFFF